MTVAERIAQQIHDDRHASKATGVPRPPGLDLVRLRARAVLGAYPHRHAFPAALEQSLIDLAAACQQWAEQLAARHSA